MKISKDNDYTASEMFYRVDENGNAKIYHECGDVVTVIITTTPVWPIDSDVSTCYENADV